MKQERSVCEESVFSEIYNKHSETIRNFIFYKCGDIDLSEDITQDAFIKLWKNCHKVIFEKAKSFVMKVAQNSTYNTLNKNKVVLNYNKNTTINGINIQSPEFILEEKEFMSKLQKCISDLPEKQRVVFLLSRKDKKTYKEISEIIGISQKGVERRMHLALTELRSKIEFDI